jgi:hypothetical protein
MNLTLITLVFLLLATSFNAQANSDWCSSNGVNGPYKFEWKPHESGEFLYGDLLIKDSTTGNVLQKISEHGSPKEWTPIFTDYNFDGCPDLSWVEFSGAQDSTNAVLLYDRTKQRFIKSELLSELSELSVHSKKHKCLSSESHGGLGRAGTDIYCWHGSKLVQIESTHWYWNESKQCQETVVKRLKKGKLRKVSVKCEKIEQDDSVWQEMYKR